MDRIHQLFSNIPSLERELKTLREEEEVMLRDLEKTRDRMRFVKQQLSNAQFTLKHQGYYNISS